MSGHSQTAQARILEVRAMRQQIPNFLIPTSKDQLQKLSTSAAVPTEFIERTAVAVTNSPVLVRGGATPPDESRDLLDYAEAYMPLADELEALAYLIRHSVAAARSKAASDALTTYALAQRLAKRPEHTELVLHVADMRRALGRSPKPKAPEPPSVPPVTLPS